MPRYRGRRARLLLLLILLSLPLWAWAQVSGSVALVSDYRFRGVSLSDDQPAAQLEIGVDHPSGIYAGLFGSNVRLYDESRSRVQGVAYAGYAWRVGNGWSLDAGGSYAGFSRDRDRDRDYAEWHAGLSSENLEAHFYVSPDYFGLDLRTLYAELNASRRLGDRWRLIAHAGALKVLAGPNGSARPVADGRVGIEFALDVARLQLSRTARQGTDNGYLANPGQRNAAWVASLAMSF